MNTPKKQHKFLAFLATPKKEHKFVALSYLAAAIIVPVIVMVLRNRMEDPVPTSLLACVIMLALAGFEWRKYKKTPEEETYYDLSKEPPATQIKICKRGILLCAIAGLLMGVWTYWRLTRPEPGPGEPRNIWGGEAMVYDLLGFWPAVLCWPVFCLFVIGVCVFIILKAGAMPCPKETKNDV